MCIRMRLNILDDQGLPPEGIERRLAHHTLGRPNPIQKRVLYSLLGGPRRNAELMAYTGSSPNNLTQALQTLREEGLIVGVVDARIRPAATGYRLTTLGLLVVDWMRRYEFLDEMETFRGRLAPPMTD